ncbi:MAG TPA: FAD-binding oxidoreductase, partial [Propionibacteriaceae bacterium]
MPNAVALPSQVAELTYQLKRRGVRHTLDSTKLTRALYSSDASLYRVVPEAVAHPRSVDEAVAVLEAARAVGMPITTRGAGTSCAGNAVGPGLVLDTSRYLNAIGTIDPEARTAQVEPGVVQSVLQAAAAPYGLRFGPDPSTHNRCTIGGMIGNNACGPRALGFGKTADNVVALDVVTGSGERILLDGQQSIDRYASLTAL